MNTTTAKHSSATSIDCSRCKAPHFSYQLTCKRCGEYLRKDDTLSAPDTHSLAIAGGILAVSVAVLTVCLVMHMF